MHIKNLSLGLGQLARNLRKQFVRSFYELQNEMFHNKGPFKVLATTPKPLSGRLGVKLPTMSTRSFKLHKQHVLKRV